MHAIPRRISARAHGASRTGQQEVVHTTDAGHRIAKTGSHARTQDCRQNHIGFLAHLEFALDDMHPSGCHHIIHLRAPNTASMAAFIFSIVNGLASTLFAPHWAAFCTRARSPWAFRKLGRASGWERV